MAVPLAPPTEAAVLEALRAVQDPDLHQDIVTLGFVKDLRICGGNVAFTIELTTPACPVKDLMKAQAERAVLGGVILGQSDREIASDRGTSVHTVAKQIAALLRKFQVSGRGDLAARAVDLAADDARSTPSQPA